MAKKAAAVAGNTDKKEVNFVHQEKILAETVRKENQTLVLHTTFGLNPYTKTYALAEKPNANPDVLVEDESFKKAINRASLEPTKKYLEPVTTNQEYGWISQPLIQLDRSDRRLYFPKNSCEITRCMKFDKPEKISKTEPVKS